MTVKFLGEGLVVHQAFQVDAMQLDNSLVVWIRFRRFKEITGMSAHGFLLPASHGYFSFLRVT